MKISLNGIAFVKAHEGLRLKAYDDGTGVWTIGYGHTKGVKSGQVVTEEEADVMLRLDLSDAESDVNREITATLNQNQYDALVDFTFNLGGGMLYQFIRPHLNAGDFDEAVRHMAMFTRAGGKLMNGLVKRRADEIRLFKGEL